MFRTSFNFANRLILVSHESIDAAFAYVSHVFANWHTVNTIGIYGGRRDGYPKLFTVTRD
jgi:hypothetical protein